MLEQEADDKLAYNDSSTSPKYIMLEKWIMDRQSKNLLIKQNWVQKQQQTKYRIATKLNNLKEAVSSSEDIYAKTKSVIELKKLKLLELQHRLRRERLEDGFKIKREHWKGFNRFIKEFHKRKERTHREKIDRIQREKINLLKINNVEGYLRMVQVRYGIFDFTDLKVVSYCFSLMTCSFSLQDAKSDWVKQLLKETENYLQKLGSKLQEAKSMANRLGMAFGKLNFYLGDMNNFACYVDIDTLSFLILSLPLELFPYNL